jgi:hypothetical protein
VFVINKAVGFEDTFAPEIASFTDPTIFGTAQLHSGVDTDGATPWSPMSLNMGYTGATPPRTMSPSLAQGVGDSSGLGVVSSAGDGASSGGVAGILHRRGNSRSGSGMMGEKHRLSLTFLRRTGSVSHGSQNPATQNGTMSPISSVGSTSPVSQAGRRAQHGVSNSIDAQLASENGANSSYPLQSTRMRGPSEEIASRSISRKSSEGDVKSYGSVRSRVGSVKKRLSLLGMRGGAGADNRLKSEFSGVAEEE